MKENEMKVMHYVKANATWRTVATRNLNTKMCIKPFFCVPPCLMFKTLRHAEFDFLAACC